MSELAEKQPGFVRPTTTHLKGEHCERAAGAHCKLRVDRAALAPSSSHKCDPRRLPGLRMRTTTLVQRTDESSIHGNLRFLPLAVLPLAVHPEHPGHRIGAGALMVQRKLGRILDGALVCRLGDVIATSGRQEDDYRLKE